MKAKCSPQQMMKVIARNMETQSDKMIPEHKLVLAIIGSGVQDLGQKAYRNSAVSFFNGPLFETYCNLVGLNPYGTKQLLIQGGFIE